MKPLSNWGKVMRFLSSVLLLLLGSTAVNAATVTLDFENLAVSTSPTGEPGILWVDEQTISDQSFVIDGYGLGGGTGLLLGEFGANTELGVCYSYGCEIDGLGAKPLFELTHETGQTFALSSLDIRDTIACLRVEGALAGGGSVTQELGTSVTGAGGSTHCEYSGAAWNTISFSSDWSNMLSVTLVVHDDFGDIGTDGEYAVFDNIVVAAVPVPAAVWLFGSALAGLGWLRRKQVSQT